MTILFSRRISAPEFFSARDLASAEGGHVRRETGPVQGEGRGGGIKKDELERAVEKVGNSATAVREVLRNSNNRTAT
jgi:hypothetical protein